MISCERIRRLRAQALWAFIVSGIGLAATVVGLAQLLLLDAVFIRPGREALVGRDAVEELVALFLGSTFFLGYGLFARSRAKRVRGKPLGFTGSEN